MAGCLRVAMMGTILLAACYTPPSPACGFICGDGNACPESYTCNPDDRICHLNGTDEACDPAPPDPGPPITSMVMPSDGATGVPTNATVMIDLSASYAPGSTIDDDRLRVFALTGEPIAGLVVPGSFDSQIVFLPNHLPNATTVTARFQAGLETADGHAIGGRVWSFQTENDTTPPTMTGTFPADGATEFPLIGLSIKVTFSEDVQNAQSGGLVVTTSDGPVPGDWSYDPTGPNHLATFSPTEILPGLTEITISSQPTLADFAGNSVVPFSISFTTVADTMAPFVLDHMPLDGDTNVPVTTTVFVDFSEPVTNVDTTRFHVAQGGTPIAGTIAMMNGNRAATFTPTGALPAASTIAVTLDASIADIVGNQLGMPVSFSFTTQ